MKTNLVICPNCQQKGKKQILGEIDELGRFVVMRFHQGTTKIIGNSFAVICGECQEPIYIKKGEKDADINYWRQWFSWQTFSQQIGTVGTPNYQGTA